MLIEIQDPEVYLKALKQHSIPRFSKKGCFKFLTGQPTLILDLNKVLIKLKYSKRDHK